MDLNRRDFFRSMGQRSLLAAGLGAGIPEISRLRANDAPAAEEGKKRMKLIVRADDVGYSEVCNIGTFKAVEKGVATSLDVMFDTPGTVDALERLRKLPWITIGWHNHCWGKPLLGAEKVPSLVGKDGHFKWSVREGEAYMPGAARLRQEKAKLENEINYDEAVAEFRAQMLLCVKIVGRAPDSGGGGNTRSLVGKAANQVAKEFGLKSGWANSLPGSITIGEVTTKLPGRPADPEYRNLNIYMPSGAEGLGKYAFDPPGKGEQERYNPLDALRKDVDGIMDKEIVQVVFHPGFVDDYVATDGGIQFIFNRVRVLDVYYLCSQEMRDWIKQDKVELINQRDALNGTHEYQNHLKETGSDLCML